MNQLIPPPERPLPPGLLDELRAAVVAEISADTPAERPLPRRRRRRWVALALVPIVLAVAATALAIHQATADEVITGVACHNEPRLESSVTGALEADGRDPIAKCAASMWPNESAPPLVACANTEHGLVEVFPSADPRLCGRLGLAPVPAGYSEAARRLKQVRLDVARELDGPTCRTQAEGRSAIRRALDRHGFGDWRVETLEFDRRPCAIGGGVWIDAPRRVFGLTGDDRPSAPPETPAPTP